jgi:hypothetical protein
MRWRRFRKWAKWACTLAAISAIGGSVLSAFYWWSWVGKSRFDEVMWSANLGGGLVWVERIDGERALSTQPDGGWSAEAPYSWRWGLAGEEIPATPGSWRAGAHFWRGPQACSAGVSVLYPILLACAAAALFWYADRARFGPGRCTKCGYDRRGLAADAKCPECGTGSVRCGGG